MGQSDRELHEEISTLRALINQLYEENQDLKDLLRSKRRQTEGEADPEPLDKIFSEHSDL